MVTGSLPFKNNYYHRIIKMITSHEIDYECFNSSVEYKTLLQQMLEKNVDKRISATDCRRTQLILKEAQINILEVSDDNKIR
jgi:hypothetical protein